MERSPEEFPSIHAEFRPRIHRYLARLVGPGEAEDLTQEVFVRVARTLPEFKGAAKLSTWIYRIATNVAVDRLRSRPSADARPGRTGAAPEAPAEDIDALPDDKRPPIERQLMRDQMSSCIQDYIGALPENYRAVVLLSEIEGLTNQEIAETLGLTLDTVKIRLHRGRARLKEKLETGCRFDRDEENVLVCDPKGGPRRTD